MGYYHVIVIIGYKDKMYRIYDVRIRPVLLSYKEVRQSRYSISYPREPAKLISVLGIKSVHLYSRLGLQRIAVVTVKRDGIKSDSGCSVRHGCLALIIRFANSNHKAVGENDGDDQGITRSNFIEGYLNT